MLLTFSGTFPVLQVLVSAIFWALFYSLTRVVSKLGSCKLSIKFSLFIISLFSAILLHLYFDDSRQHLWLWICEIGVGTIQWPNLQMLRNCSPEYCCRVVTFVHGLVVACSTFAIHFCIGPAPWEVFGAENKWDSRTLCFRLFSIKSRILKKTEPFLQYSQFTQFSCIQ